MNFKRNKRNTPVGYESFEIRTRINLEFEDTETSKRTLSKTGLFVGDFIKAVYDACQDPILPNAPEGFSQNVDIIYGHGDNRPVTPGQTYSIGLYIDGEFVLKDYDPGEPESRDFPGEPDFFNDYMSRDEVRELINNYDILGRVCSLLKERFPGMANGDYSVGREGISIEVEAYEDVMDRVHIKNEHDRDL